MTSTDQRRRLEGVLALLAVQLFFGLFPYFAKLSMGEGGFSPGLVAAWRIFFGALVLTLMASTAGLRALVPPRADVPRLFACALFGVVINQVLALEGMERTTVTHAGLLMVLIPVFTYGLAVAVRQEVFRWARALGIGLALVGAVVLVLERSGEGEAGSEAALGNALIVANCFSYAGYLVLARPLLARHSPAHVIAWVFVFSTITVPFLGIRDGWLPPAPTARVWWAMAFVLVFPTALAYFLNTYALARVSASTTAVFIYLQPLIAGAAGVWWLDEVLGPATWVAAGCLFGGIALVLFVRGRPPAPPAPGAPGARGASAPAPDS